MQVGTVEDALQMAAENGIPLSGPPCVVGSLLLLPTDPTSEELATFYSWPEIRPGDVPMRETWRPFLWSEDEEWGVNTGLQEIALGGGHTVFSVVSRILAEA